MMGDRAGGVAREAEDPLRSCGPPLEIITVLEAARRLGISSQRVRALIAAGRLPARKAGRDWIIRPADLALVAHRVPGRPRTTTPKGGTR